MDGMNPRLVEDLEGILSGVELPEAETGERPFGDHPRGRFSDSVSMAVETVQEKLPSVGIAHVTITLEDGSVYDKGLYSWPLHAEYLGNFFVDNFFHTPVRVEVSGEGHSYLSEVVEYDAEDSEHRYLSALGGIYYLYGGVQEEMARKELLGPLYGISKMINRTPDEEDLWVIAVSLPLILGCSPSISAPQIRGGMKRIKEQMLMVMGREEFVDFMDQLLLLIPEEYRQPLRDNGMLEVGR